MPDPSTETARAIRRRLDLAIADALPLAGGRILTALTTLQRELEQFDQERAASGLSVRRADTARAQTGPTCCTACAARAQARAAAEPLADWERDLLTRQQIASDLDALAGSEQLTRAWLERHRLPACPSPPEVLRAVAIDVAACRLHGRRERWILDGLVGGYVCAEPDPAGPDGECGMPVEDVPCTIHHPDGPRP